MRFFDKIDNGVIVNAFKQFLNRTDREIFFHGYRANLHIPREYGLVSVEVDKNIGIARHRKINASCLYNYRRTIVRVGL